MIWLECIKKQHRCNQVLSTWNVSSVTVMSGMYAGESLFNQDLSQQDVSSVTDMSGMLREASSFHQGLFAWNVSSVTEMNFMFGGASMFNQDLSQILSVTGMSGMFHKASLFNQDLSHRGMSSVTDMTEIFEKATSFNQELSRWNVSSVTDMQRLLYGTTSVNQDLCHRWLILNLNVNRDQMLDGTACRSSGGLCHHVCILSITSREDLLSLIDGMFRYSFPPSIKTCRAGMHRQWQIWDVCICIVL